MEFLANAVYFSGKTLRADLDNVPFYLNIAEFKHYNSVKERFLVRKIVILVCMPCGPPKG